VAPTTELVLVRHGEAIANIEWLKDLSGECRGLTERGHAQAELVAARLAKQMSGARPFDVVCHSPVRRAVETTGHITAALGPRVPVEAVDDLRIAAPGEPGTHAWDPATNLIGTIPPLAPDESPNPGAESWQCYLDRSSSALAEIGARYAGARVLVVAHAETAASAIQAFARLAPGHSAWFFPLINHTGLTGWRHQYTPYARGDARGQWALMYLNDDTHLPETDRMWSAGTQ
jgi:probable phosphoglycerate mutase